MRSKNGKAYWQTGHDTLKKMANTGPCASTFSRENFAPPSMSGSSNWGAVVPTDNVAIRFPPNNRLSNVIASSFGASLVLDDTCSAQDFFCKPRQWKPS